MTAATQMLPSSALSTPSLRRNALDFACCSYGQRLDKFCIAWFGKAGQLAGGLLRSVREIDDFPVLRDQRQHYCVLGSRHVRRNCIGRYFIDAR